MPTISITIGRRLDNRERGESDDSPLAWELHRNRARIVHAELEGEPEWTVAGWGGTDDVERTHEDVTVLLEVAQAAGPVALGFAGTVLYKVLEDTVVVAVKKLVKKFARRLFAREITRAYIKLPDGATLEWNAPGYYGDVDIRVTARVSLSREALERE